MAQIQKRPNGWWRIVLYHKGRRFVQSLKTKSERDALAAKARVEENLRLVRRGRLKFDEKAGDDLLSVLLSDGRMSQPLDVKKPATLGFLIDAYLADRPARMKEANTHATEDIHLRHIRRIIGEKTPLVNVGAQLQGYINARAAETPTNGRKLFSSNGSPRSSAKLGVSRLTIRKELVTFSTVWNRWAFRKELVPGKLDFRGLNYPKTAEKPPFQTWEQITRRVAAGAEEDLWDSVFLSVTEIEEFVNHVRANVATVGPMVVAMVAFVAYTGARRSEMMRSQLEDFDFGANGRQPVVTIREKKKKQAVSLTFRTVPMQPALVAAMQDWFQNHHPGGLLTFCGFRWSQQTQGRQIAVKGKELTSSQAKTLWRRAVRGSKWEVLRGWHTLRHSLISALVARGCSERVIMEIAGHVDSETSRRYQHLAPEFVRNVLTDVFGQGGQSSG